MVTGGIDFAVGRVGGHFSGRMLAGAIDLSPRRTLCRAATPILALSWFYPVSAPPQDGEEADSACRCGNQRSSPE